MFEMVIELRSCNDPFLRAVGYCCMPYCEWYGGRCPEIHCCHLREQNKLSTVIINKYKDDCFDDEKEEKKIDKS